MRLGLLARATQRGLGVQTRSLHDHLRPDRTLLIDLGLERDPLALHPEWYQHAWDVVSPEQLTDEELDAFLDGLDAVLTCETFYREALPDLARERGVRTVLQGNYEFLWWLTRPELPRPDLFLAPSTWHLDRWPENTLYLPFPVDRARHPFRLRTEARTLLHVGGWPAMRDRAGTHLFLAALAHVRVPIRAIVTSQSRVPTSLTRRVARCVELDLRVGDAEDLGPAYDQADVLVAPRRFGGQSLPLNEAASRGLALLTLDRLPEREFVPPEGLVPCSEAQAVRVQSGQIAVADARPEDLAAAIHRLVAEPESVALLSKASDAWAESIAWSRLRPQYEATLGAA